VSEPTAEDVAQAVHEGRAPSSLIGDAAPSTAAPTAAGPAAGEPVSAGGLTVEVRGGSLLEASSQVLAEARDAGLAAALAAKDATLWGPEATPEASIRLGWLDVVDTGRPVVEQVLALREELAGEGVDRVVLCGMGGSSLAPEVICGSAGVPLVVVDTTDPAQVRAALVELERTVVVVSSKSGRHARDRQPPPRRRAAFEARASTRRPASSWSPTRLAVRAGRPRGGHPRGVPRPTPDVGGRYSALTAFGLVPAGLAGVGRRLAARRGGGRRGDAHRRRRPGRSSSGRARRRAVDGRDKLVLVDDGTLVGFGDWAEQLVAESTGKQGKGLLPVVVEGPDAPGTEPAADTHLVLVGAGAVDAPEVPSTVVTGPLGGQFLAWEYATAVAGWALQINPFDQPNVQESKDNTSAILDGAPSPEREPLLVEGGVEVHATGDLLAEVTDLAGALRALLGAVPERGYLAVMAYLDRLAEAEAAQLRPLLAARLAHPVTFGWAPRFLHSTGQFHKGGPQSGAFLQVTADPAQDLEVPGRPFTFGRLQAAQALGDLRALGQRDRPVLHLHLADRSEGLATLLRVAKG
jgi:glucose-6-phosphate isomerase